MHGVDVDGSTVLPVPKELETVARAIEDVAVGRPVLVLDDENRENEADIVFAAQRATPALVAFTIRHTSGLLCVSLPGDRVRHLGLPPMVKDNTDPRGTAFTVSVDARPGTTTGISAADRCATILTLADPHADAEDLSRPGHVFPLRARTGGVLRRAGHTEAAIDLTRLAGLQPAGVLAELVNDDGTVARRGQAARFAATHGLTVITIEDLVRYRYQYDRLVRRVASSSLPTRVGPFRAHVYVSQVDGTESLVLVRGEPEPDEPVLVRVHSECLTGDVFGSSRCDCGEQLDMALSVIAAAGRGVVVYLRGQEGRGIGLAHKLRAYSLQDRGLDTVDANLALGLPVDDRSYGIGAQMLADVGVRRMRLLTNNPAKYDGLGGYGLEIVERVPLVGTPNGHNLTYLRAKQDRLGHHLGLA